MHFRLKLRGKSIERLSRRDWDKIHAVLVVRKRAALMERLDSLYPLPRLAQIFRAMNGDKEAQRGVRIRDVAGLENARTFAEFLQINRFPVYEEVLR